MVKRTPSQNEIIKQELIRQGLLPTNNILTSEGKAVSSTTLRELHLVNSMIVHQRGEISDTHINMSTSGLNMGFDAIDLLL